jgi:saccharopine dehydrogenase-like NADP-dependent oxidoreductase
MAGQKRVVVLGGTGHFGARICRRLVNDPSIDLVVTSRSADRAARLVDDLRSHSRSVASAAVDQDVDDVPTRLKELGTAIVIHTAGPYQGRDYSVARACIEAGCHYIDLADGRAFVEEFDSLDDAAKQAGVTLVSGASTLPGVSSAVLDEYRKRFSHIDSIEIVIAPAHQTPRGPGTVAAVLGYCGESLRMLRHGEWSTVHGWQDLRLQRCREFGTRLSGACDVPDLGLFPDYVVGVRTVTFHAALEAPWEQLALWCMAVLRRTGLVDDWARHAGKFSRVSERLIRLGSVRGGMRIRLRGADCDGRSQSHEWVLAAGSNHGPEIPCTPAIVLTKKLVRGELTHPGARPCLGLFSIDELMAELSGFDIRVTEHLSN